MSTDAPEETVRLSFACPAALAASLKMMSERSGIPLHVLLVRVCEDLARNGVSVRVEPVTSVRASSTQKPAGSALLRPTYASDLHPAHADDEEDTQQCPDCAEIVPMSGYTPGMEHRACERPGEGLAAKIRALKGE